MTSSSGNYDVKSFFDIMWEKRPTDFILGYIILHLRTVIQINIIYFCFRKRDTGSGPLYPIMGFGQIYVYNNKLNFQIKNVCIIKCKLNAKTKRVFMKTKNSVKTKTTEGKTVRQTNTSPNHLNTFHLKFG